MSLRGAPTRAPMMNDATCGGSGNEPDPDVAVLIRLDLLAVRRKPLLQRGRLCQQSGQ
jgi:hypothetical protein